AYGGNEVIGIDLQGLVTIADRFVEVAQGVMGIGPLIPGLGKVRLAFDDVASHANHLFELPRRIQANDRVDLDAILLAGRASPYLANAVLGKDPHGAVLVEQRRAKGGVRFVIAQAAQGKDRRATDLASRVSGQSLQSAGRITISHSSGKGTAIGPIQVFPVKRQKSWLPWFVAHAVGSAELDADVTGSIVTGLAEFCQKEIDLRKSFLQ